MPYKKARSFKVIKQISGAALDADDQIYRLNKLHSLFCHSLDHLYDSPNCSKFLLELLEREFETEIKNLTITVKKIRCLLGHPL